MDDLPTRIFRLLFYRLANGVCGWDPMLALQDKVIICVCMCVYTNIYIYIYIYSIGCINSITLLLLSLLLFLSFLLCRDPTPAVQEIAAAEALHFVRNLADSERHEPAWGRAIIITITITITITTITIINIIVMSSSSRSSSTSSSNSSSSSNIYFYYFVLTIMYYC